MAIGDILEVNIDYAVHQRPLVMRLWYRITQDPGSPDRRAQDLCDAIVAEGVITELATLVGDQCRFDCVKAWVRFSEGPFAIVNAAPGYNQLDVVGTKGSGESLVDSLPLVIEWIQSTVSAVANGRAFLSGLLEADVDGNRITAAYQTGVLAAFEAKWTADLLDLSGPDSGIYDHQLVSREDSLGVPPLQTYGQAISVTGVTCNPVIKNQKRRQSRHEGAGHA